MRLVLWYVLWLYMWAGRAFLSLMRAGGSSSRTLNHLQDRLTTCTLGSWHQPKVQGPGSIGGKRPRPRWIQDTSTPRRTKTPNAPLLQATGTALVSRPRAEIARQLLQLGSHLNSGEAEIDLTGPSV
jgi:hypothetical protein